LLAACAALGATACGRHVYLGTLTDGSLTTDGGPTDAVPGILWQATFEPGDLSEWLADGNGGIYMDSTATAPAATQAAAHRGAWAGIATFASVSPISFSYLYREQPSPPEAYYGAWFFIPTSLRVGSWVSLLHFGYHRTAGSADTITNEDAVGSQVPRKAMFLTTPATRPRPKVVPATGLPTASPIVP